MGIRFADTLSSTFANLKRKTMSLTRDAAFTNNNVAGGIRMAKPKDLEPAFTLVFKSDKPVIVDEATDPSRFWIERGQ